MCSRAGMSTPLWEEGDVVDVDEVVVALGYPLHTDMEENVQGYVQRPMRHDRFNC